jgi:hypothetical protein
VRPRRHAADASRVGGHLLELWDSVEADLERHVDRRRRRVARPPSTPACEVDAAARSRACSRAMSRSRGSERCFPSHSPTLRPWIVEMRRPTWRGFGARRSCDFGKCACKSRSVISSEFCCAESAVGPFSRRRGLKSFGAYLKLGITPLVRSF